MKERGRKWIWCFQGKNSLPSVCSLVCTEHPVMLPALGGKWLSWVSKPPGFQKMRPSGSCCNIHAFYLESCLINSIIHCVLFCFAHFAQSLRWTHKMILTKCSLLVWDLVGGQTEGKWDPGLCLLNRTSSSLSPAFSSPAVGYIESSETTWPRVPTTNQGQLHAFMADVDEVTSLASGEMGLRSGLSCFIRGPRNQPVYAIETHGS